MTTRVVHRRLQWLDSGRAIAVLLMVATHATDAFLAVGYRSGWLWDLVFASFGLVAPLFLFFSGVTLRIALDRREERGRSLWDLFGRATGVLLLGYWLQIPGHSLQRVLKRGEAGVAAFLDFNVLQVIGLTGLVVLALYSLVRNVHARQAALAGAVLLLIGASRSLHEAISTLPRLIWHPLDSSSTFPILPNAAYLLAGTLAWPWIRQWRSRSAETRILAISSLIGAAGIFGVIGAAPGVEKLIGEYWESSPALVSNRLLLTASFVLVLQTVGETWRETRFQLLGAGSLTIYVLHLMVIYGSPVTEGVIYWFGGAFYRSLTLAETALVGGAIGLLTAEAAILWQKLKREKSAYANSVLRWWWIAFAIFFLLWPV